MLRQSVYDRSLLDEGPAVWRKSTADRLTPLMENNTYFEALDEAIEKAEKSILILGWQFDPRTRLDPQAPIDQRRYEIGESHGTRPPRTVRKVAYLALSFGDCGLSGILPAQGT